MRFCKPFVNIIGGTEIDEVGVREMLGYYGADKWYTENVENQECSNEELLSEIFSRACYKSFGVGLNPNVTKVREGNAEHLENVIKSGHGSVLEHCMVNFMFQDVSRVFTHELVRHRVGTAMSQESLRFVRLTELKCFDFPRLKDELTEEEERYFRDVTETTFEYLEQVQKDLTVKFKLDDEQSFARKKKLTSRMRRLAPLGLLTNIGWSANFRTLRYIIPLRTHKSAEEEIRFVYADVGNICKQRWPNIFFDMEWHSDEDGTGMGEWRIENRKV
jgi:thymidylate synthase (FAD)